MNKLFDISNLNNKAFSVTDYNEKKNIELKNDIKNIDYNKVDELYSLLEQYKLSKLNQKLLNIIKSKIEFEKYNIKGICQKNNSSYSLINNYTEFIFDKKRYDFTFILSKIINKENNKHIFNEQNKYTIKILNIKEDDKKNLEKYVFNLPKSALLFTNLIAKLKLDNNTKQLHFIFKSTLKTKIYMEKNQISDTQKSKNNFSSSGIFIDYLKSNEFSYIDSISTQKLYSLRSTRFKNNLIKGFNFDLYLDLKLYLEIGTESLYMENLKDEYLHFYPNKEESINLCCFVKSICEDKIFKKINIVLENIFDLNSIILEIPQNHEILQNLYLNCIYLFVNMIIFIDDKFNIKLTVQKNIGPNSKIILLYYLIDPDKYIHKKLDDSLIQTKFSQLLPLIMQNKVTRTVNKYFVNIIKISYMNIYFSKDTNDFIYYDLYLHCSDGTSSAFCHIKGNDLSDLKKLNVNINPYLNNRNNDETNLITVFPTINDEIQLIILGVPIPQGLKELSFLYIYENINELKKDENMHKNEDEKFHKFDSILTKNEFTPINGTFLKNSKSLEPIPVIKVLKFVTSDEYINFIEQKKNINNDI